MKKIVYFIAILLFAMIACRNDKSVCYLNGTIDNGIESEWLYLTGFDSRILCGTL